MRRSLFEPPIGPYYSYDFFLKFCGRSPEKSRDQNFKIYGEIIILGYLRRKLLFGKILFVYRKKAIFTANTLNMTILSLIKNSPRNAVSIPA